MALDPNKQLSFYRISSYSDWQAKKKAINNTNIGYEVNGTITKAGAPDIKANSIVFIDETK